MNRFEYDVYTRYMEKVAESSMISRIPISIADYAGRILADAARGGVVGGAGRGMKAGLINTRDYLRNDIALKDALKNIGHEALIGGKNGAKLNAEFGVINVPWDDLMGIGLPPARTWSGVNFTNFLFVQIYSCKTPCYIITS